MQSKSFKMAMVFALLIAILGGAYWYKNKNPAPGGGLEVNDDPNAPLTLVDAADRGLDGAPALALTFSIPLDSGKNYDKYLQVFEMPPSAADLKKTETTNNDEDNGYDDDGQPKKGKVSAVSTKPEDTDSKGGKPVSGAWVVGDNPRLLFFPHIKPQTRYVIQVQTGLPARNGKTLGAEARYSIVSAPVSPSYYFASNGMVLPAKQNGGLPVVTVNVPEVDVQFLRVKNDQLPRFLDRVINGKPKTADEAKASDGDGEGDSDYNYDWRRSALKGAVQVYQLDDLRNMTDSVYMGRFMTEQKPNKRSVTYISVEDIKEIKEPGVYVAVMSQPGRFRYEFQTTYFYVSDLGLQTRLYDKAADAFVSSLTDGKAVSGVEVSWMDEAGKVLARAETDGDGHVSFAEQPKTAKVLLARKGEQISLLALKEPALDLSEYDITGAPFKATRLFAYSGRNLYRPGEQFDVSVLARDADGHTVPAKAIQARLKRPDGKDQFTATWRPDQRFGGYLVKRLELPADAPTGFWTLELRADPADKVPGTVFRFGVEEFLPERMKLDLSSKQATLAADSDYTVDVEGNYLYGAPAAGNRLLGVAQFERNKNPLAKQYPGFEFGDVTENEAKTRTELEESKLDDAGKASVDVDLTPVAKRRSPFTVRTTLSLLESGGRPVVRSLEKTVWPAPVLIGLRPMFTGEYAPEGSPVEFEVIRADQNGKLQASPTLPVRLFREDRNYYWRFEDQRGWQSGFTETDELVETAATSVPANGRGKIRLPVRYGRYRMEVLDPDTKLSAVYRFYVGWSARTDETQGVRPDKVAMKLDKPSYKDGDTARLTMTPPHKGEALITVEGDKTLWIKRMAVGAEATTIDIPLNKEWKRHDLYVSAVVLRPGNEGDKVTPARALGLAHIPFERADRKYAVTMEAPVKVLPDSTVKVKIKVPEAKGQKTMVTLSAVDVGILNITKFVSPDPHAFFFAKLRYGSDQHDIYGRLIEKMQGQKGKLKFGGDNTPKPTKNLPKKVKLIDIFSGPVQLNDQGEAEIPLAIPDFNGTLRLMAVVAGGERFGAKDAEMTVAAPLIAELATPRFLSFGDNAIVALDLHNLSGAVQNLKVSINGGEALKLTEAERTLSLKDQQKQTLRFPIEAKPMPGLHTITVNISGSGIKMERSFALTVQAPTPQTQITKRFTIKAGESLDIREAELGGLHRASLAAHMVMSNKAPIDIRAAIQGLLTYPYGCAEQTTSTAYPHVFVDEEAAKRFGLKAYTREQRVEMLDKAIARLATMQAPNGGFSLWGNASEYEYWLSAYVTGFLVDAREQGFGVPDAMYNKALDYLLRGLQEGVARLPSNPKPVVITGNSNSLWEENRVRDNSHFGVLAAGAYVLSRQNKAPLATLRQLHDSRGNAQSGLALIQLGVALKQMGDKARSDVALAEGVKKGRDNGYWWYDYGSNLRDAALSYALLDRHQITIPGRDNLVAVIAAEMEKYRYYSTQEKLALFLVGRSYNTGDTAPWTGSLTVAGKAEEIGAKTSLFRELPAGDLSAGLKLTNNSKDNLYVELSMSGNPVKLPPAKSDVIELSRKMYNPDGTEINGRALKVGETILMRITARSRSAMGTGMIVDRIPAGLEIENTNIVQGEQMNAVTIDKLNPAEVMQDPHIKHVEFRDDRFVAAVRMDWNVLNLFYRVRVVTPGKFVIPPLYAEDMYRPDLYGQTGGTDVLTVVESGK
ncbi:alpha-2-macroglobulin [Undibacterium sp. TS12]|uniref:alpha-2-macroglobulin family protein n=1 Tax=Undibacterium sp. TS12 TaxID=2908202 RepID=UPI001F4CE9CA|nr:alpha-2-macroglobulin [Undibacterium sp. TS12]MCH8621492.1 alpha-2-macroglobulin family protein [Undibacterium sp. TS12]